MLRIYLFMFVLLFSANVFSESTTYDIENPVEETFEESNVEFNMEFSSEHSPDSYHVLNNPEFAFENFDMDILEKQKYTDTESEPEEIIDNNCNRTVRQPDNQISQIEPIYNPDNLHDPSPDEEFLAMLANDPVVYRTSTAFSKQANTSEQCEQYTFNVIHSNLYHIHDEENMRYMNINYYPYQ